MATIEVKQVMEMFRKVGNEWWLTPHVIYTLTDDHAYSSTDLQRL